MSPEEKSVGAYLRREREKKGISLRQISDTTRIHMRYLEALETDRFDIFLVESHIRNFLMTYARTIQIDEDVPLELFEAMMATEKEREKDENIRREQVRSRRRRRTMGISAAAAVAGLLLLYVALTRLLGGGGAGSAAREARSDEARPVAALPQPVPEPTPPPRPEPVPVLQDTLQESPLFVSGRVLISGHGLSSWNREYWWVYSSVQIGGVSGPDQVKSLSYLSPEGKLIDMAPEETAAGRFNGRYIHSDSDLDSPPPLGDYHFVLVDRMGREKRFTVRLTRVMENLPVMDYPSGNQEVPAGDLEIVWQGVPGAVTYTIHVKTMENTRLWVRRGATETRLRYNDDGAATVAALAPGKYILSVYAHDSRGNMAVRHIYFSVAG